MKVSIKAYSFLFILFLCFIRPTQAAIEVEEINHPTTASSCDGSLVIRAESDAGFDSAGPFQFKWSHDASLQENQANNLCNDTYSITVTNAYGCETILEAVLNSNPSLTGNNHHGLAKSSNDNHHEQSLENSKKTKEKQIMVVYPNPFSHSFQIKLFTKKIEKIVITDMVGKEVFTIFANHNRIPMVNMEHYFSGLYILKAFDKKGELIGVEKIVKHQKGF